MIGSHLAHINRASPPGRRLLLRVVVYTPLDGFTSVVVDGRTLRSYRRFCTVLKTKKDVWFERPEYRGPDGQELWTYDVGKIVDRPPVELDPAWVAEVERWVAAMREPVGV